MGRHQQFLKFVAIFVILCLLAQDAAMALPSTQPQGHRPEAREESFSELRAPDSGLKIHSNLGYVDEFFEGTNGKHITFILDAHDSLDAQKNIVRIIQQATNSGIKTVFEEGYEGELNTDDWFGDIEDGQIRRKVSYYYLDQLKIGAAEFAHINRHRRLGRRPEATGQSLDSSQSSGLRTPGVRVDWKLIGADDKKAYLENVHAYGDSEKVRDQILRDTQAIQRELKSLGGKQFSSEAQKWISDYRRFHENTLPLLDYLSRWIQFTPQEACPLLRRILAATQNPEIARSIQKTRAAEILSEIQVFELALEKHFFTNKQTAEIWQAWKTMSAVEKLAGLQISNHELSALKANLKTWKTENIAPFLARAKNNPVVISRRWEMLIQNALRFYELAHQRDEAVERTLKEWVRRPETGDPIKKTNLAPQASGLGSSKNSSAVLVFGGFHREGITEILRRNGFSYTVVIPKIVDFSKRHQALYREAMTAGPRGSGLRSLATVQAARPLSLFLDPGFSSEIQNVVQLAAAHQNLDQRSFALLAQKMFAARGIVGGNLSRPSGSPNTRRISREALEKARSESRSQKKVEQLVSEAEKLIRDKASLREWWEENIQNANPTQEVKGSLPTDFLIVFGEIIPRPLREAKQLLEQLNERFLAEQTEAYPANAMNELLFIFCGTYVSQKKNLWNKAFKQLSKDSRKIFNSAAKQHDGLNTLSNLSMYRDSVFKAMAEERNFKRADVFEAIKARQKFEHEIDALIWFSRVMKTSEAGKADPLDAFYRNYSKPLGRDATATVYHDLARQVPREQITPEFRQAMTAYHDHLVEYRDAFNFILSEIDKHTPFRSEARQNKTSDVVSTQEEQKTRQLLSRLEGYLPQLEKWIGEKKLSMRSAQAQNKMAVEMAVLLNAYVTDYVSKNKPNESVNVFRDGLGKALQIWDIETHVFVGGDKDKSLPGDIRGDLVRVSDFIKTMRLHLDAGRWQALPDYYDGNRLHLEKVKKPVDRPNRRSEIRSGERSENRYKAESLASIVTVGNALRLFVFLLPALVLFMLGINFIAGASLAVVLIFAYLIYGFAPKLEFADSVKDEKGPVSALKKRLYQSLGMDSIIDGRMAALRNKNINVLIERELQKKFGVNAPKIVGLYVAGSVIYRPYMFIPASDIDLVAVVSDDITTRFHISLTEDEAIKISPIEGFDVHVKDISVRVIGEHGLSGKIPASAFLSIKSFLNWLIQLDVKHILIGERLYGKTVLSSPAKIYIGLFSVAAQMLLLFVMPFVLYLSPGLMFAPNIKMEAVGFVAAGIIFFHDVLGYFQKPVGLKKHEIRFNLYESYSRFLVAEFKQFVSLTNQADITRNRSEARAGEPGIFDEFGGFDNTAKFLLKGLKQHGIPAQQVYNLLTLYRPGFDSSTNGLLAGDDPRSFKSKANAAQRELLKELFKRWSLSNNEKIMQIIVAGIGSAPNELMELITIFSEAVDQAGQSGDGRRIDVLALNLKEKDTAAAVKVFDYVREQAETAASELSEEQIKADLRGRGLDISALEHFSFESLQKLVGQLRKKSGQSLEWRIFFKQANVLSAPDLRRAKEDFEKEFDVELNPGFIFERNLSYLSSEASYAPSRMKRFQEYEFPLVEGYWVMRNLLSVFGSKDVFYVQEVSEYFMQEPRHASGNTTVFLADGARIVTRNELSPEQARKEYSENGFMNFGTGIQQVPDPSRMRRMTLTQFVSNAKARSEARQNKTSDVVSTQEEQKTRQLLSRLEGYLPQLEKWIGEKKLSVRSAQAQNKMAVEMAVLLNAYVTDYVKKNIPNQSVDVFRDVLAKSLQIWDVETHVFAKGNKEVGLPEDIRGDLVRVRDFIKTMRLHLDASRWQALPDYYDGNRLHLETVGNSATSPAHRSEVRKVEKAVWSAKGRIWQRMRNHQNDQIKTPYRVYLNINGESIPAAERIAEKLLSESGSPSLSFKILQSGSEGIENPQETKAVFYVASLDDMVRLIDRLKSEFGFEEHRLVRGAELLIGTAELKQEPRIAITAGNRNQMQSGQESFSSRLGQLEEKVGGLNPVFENRSDPPASPSAGRIRPDSKNRAEMRARLTEWIEKNGDVIGSSQVVARAKLSGFFSKILNEAYQAQLRGESNEIKVEISEALDALALRWSVPTNGEIAAWLATASMAFSNPKNMMMRMKSLDALPDSIKLDTLFYAMLAMTNHIRKNTRHEPERIGSHGLFFLDDLYLTGSTALDLEGIIEKFLKLYIQTVEKNPVEFNLAVQKNAEGETVSKRQIYLRGLAAALNPRAHYSTVFDNPHYQAATEERIHDSRNDLMMRIQKHFTGEMEQLKAIWREVLETDWERLELLPPYQTRIIHAYSPASTLKNSDVFKVSQLSRGVFVSPHLNIFAPTKEGGRILTDPADEFKNTLTADLSVLVEQNTRSEARNIEDLIKDSKATDEQLHEMFADNFPGRKIVMLTRSVSKFIAHVLTSPFWIKGSFVVSVFWLFGIAPFPLLLFFLMTPPMNVLHEMSHYAAIRMFKVPFLFFTIFDFGYAVVRGSENVKRFAVIAVTLAGPISDVFFTGLFYYLFKSYESIPSTALLFTLLRLPDWKGDYQDTAQEFKDAFEEKRNNPNLSWRDVFFRADTGISRSEARGFFTRAWSLAGKREIRAVWREVFVEFAGWVISVGISLGLGYWLSSFLFYSVGWGSSFLGWMVMLSLSFYVYHLLLVPRAEAIKTWLFQKSASARVEATMDDIHEDVLEKAVKGMKRRNFVRHLAGLGVGAFATLKSWEIVSERNPMDSPVIQAQALSQIAEKERPFLEADVGYNSISGITYDGINFDSTENKASLTFEVRNWTAPSKEALHLTLMMKALLQNPHAQKLVNLREDQILEVLEKKLITYEKLNEAYPGYGGYLPWLRVEKNGNVEPLPNWLHWLPPLDNGQWAWALWGMSRALRERADKIKNKKESKKYFALAERIEKYTRILADNGVTLFHEKDGLIRGETYVRDPRGFVTPQNYAGDAGEKAESWRKPYFIQTPFEGKQFLWFLDMFGKWPHPDDREKMWAQTNRGLNIKEVQLEDGRNITVQEQHKGWPNEYWHMLILPYKKVPAAWELLRNTMKALTHHARESGLIGLFAPIRDLDKDEYTHSIGYAKVAQAREELKTSDIISPAGATGLLIAEPKKGMDWFHLVTAENLPWLENPIWSKWGSRDGWAQRGTTRENRKYGITKTWDGLLYFMALPGMDIASDYERWLSPAQMQRFQSVENKLYAQALPQIENLKGRDIEFAEPMDLSAWKKAQIKTDVLEQKPLRLKTDDQKNLLLNLTKQGLRVDYQVTAQEQEARGSIVLNQRMAEFKQLVFTYRIEGGARKFRFDFKDWDGRVVGQKEIAQSGEFFGKSLSRKIVFKEGEWPANVKSVDIIIAAESGAPARGTIWIEDLKLENPSIHSKSRSEVRQFNAEWNEEAMAQIENANPGTRAKILRILETPFSQLVLDRDYDDQGGRGVLIYLDQPVDFIDKQTGLNETLRTIKVKGATFENEDVLPDFNLLRLDPSVTPDQAEKFGKKLMEPSFTKEGRFLLAPKRPTAEGAMRLDMAQQEYQISQKSFYAGLPVPVALGMVEFQNKNSDGSPAAAVILGVASVRDLRVTNLIGFKTQAYLQSVAGSMDPAERAALKAFFEEDVVRLADAQGQALRAFNDRGFIHPQFHLGNGGANIDLEEGLVSIYLVDHEGSLERTKLTEAQFLGWLVLGLKQAGKRIHDLTDKRYYSGPKLDWTSAFIRGYFGRYADRPEIKKYLSPEKSALFIEDLHAILFDAEKQPIFEINSPLTGLLAQMYGLKKPRRSEARSALEIFDKAADNLLAYPKTLFHSRGLEPYLDAFDREHYVWDEVHQQWVSKDFHPTITGAKRLTLGSWEDIQRASPDEHARMKNFVAIRLKTEQGPRSFYAFDDHGWSLQAYAEAHWRREIPAFGNTQIFIDKHGDDRRVHGGQYYAERFLAMLRQDAGTNNNIEFDMGGFNNTLWASGFIPKENHHRYHARMGWLTEMLTGFPSNQAVLLNVDTDATEFIVGEWKNEMPLGLGEEDFESLAVDLTNLRDQYSLTPFTAHFTTTHFENENLADFSLHSNRIQYGDTELARFLARVAPFIYFVKDQSAELRDQAIAQAAQEHAAQWERDFGVKFNRSEMRPQALTKDETASLLDSIQSNGMKRADGGKVWLFGEQESELPFAAGAGYLEFNPEIPREWFMNKNVLVAPGYGNLPFLIRQLGAEHVTAVDKDELTILWQKARYWMSASSLRQMLLNVFDTTLRAKIYWHGLMVDALSLKPGQDDEQTGMDFLTADLSQPLTAGRKYDLVVMPYVFAVQNGLENEAVWNQALTNIEVVLNPEGRILIMPAKFDMSLFPDSPRKQVMEDFSDWLESLKNRGYSVEASEAYPHYSMIPMHALAASFVTIQRVRSETRSALFGLAHHENSGPVRKKADWNDGIGLWSSPQVIERLGQFVLDPLSISLWRLKASAWRISESDVNAVRDEVLRQSQAWPRAEVFQNPDFSPSYFLHLQWPYLKNIKPRPADDPDRFAVYPLWEELERLSKKIRGPGIYTYETIRTAGRYSGIWGHGTASSVLREAKSDYERWRLRAVHDHDLEDEWAMLNIMIEGEINEGEGSPFAGMELGGDTPDSWGPFWILTRDFQYFYKFHPSGREDHWAYVVPNQAAINFFERGLELAVSRELMTEAERQDVRSKLITHDEFNALGELLWSVRDKKITITDAVKQIGVARSVRSEARSAKQEILYLISDAEIQSQLIWWLPVVKAYWFFRGHRMKIIRNATSDDLKQAVQDNRIRKLAVVGHGSWNSWKANDKNVTEDELDLWMEGETQKKDLFITYTCCADEAREGIYIPADKFGWSATEEPYYNVRGAVGVTIASFFFDAMELYTVDDLLNRDSWRVRFFNSAWPWTMYGGLLIFLDIEIWTVLLAYLQIFFGNPSSLGEAFLYAGAMALGLRLVFGIRAPFFWKWKKAKQWIENKISARNRYIRKMESVYQEANGMLSSLTAREQLLDEMTAMWNEKLDEIARLSAATQDKESARFTALQENIAAAKQRSMQARLTRDESAWQDKAKKIVGLAKIIHESRETASKDDLNEILAERNKLRSLKKVTDKDMQREFDLLVALIPTGERMIQELFELNGVKGSAFSAEISPELSRVVKAWKQSRSEARLDELLDKNRRTNSEWSEMIALIKKTMPTDTVPTVAAIAGAPAAQGKIRAQTLVVAVNNAGGDYSAFGLSAQEKNSIAEKETKIKAAVQALTAEKKIPSPEAVLTHLQKPKHFFKGLDEGALRKLGLVFPEKEKTADEKYMPILEALAAGGKKFETVREIAVAAAGVPESYVKELGAPKLATMGLLVGGTNPYEKLSQRFQDDRAAKIEANSGKGKKFKTIAELAESTGIPATTLAHYTDEQLEELGYIPRPVKIERAVKALLVEKPEQVISYEVLAQKVTEMDLEELKPEQLREWNLYQKPPFTAQPGWRKRFEPIMKAVEALGASDSELDLFFNNSLGAQTVWIWQIEYFVAKAADILKQNPYFRSRWNEQTEKDFTAAVMRAHTVTEPEKSELQQISAKDAALKWLVATGGAETLKPVGPVSTIQISLEGFSESGQTLYEKYEYEKTNGLSAEMLVEQLGFSDQPGAKRRLTDIKQVLIDGIDQGRSWHKISLSSRTSALVVRHKNYQKPQASLAESKTNLNGEKISVPRRKLKTKLSPSRAMGRRDARYWTIAMLSATQHLEVGKFFDAAEQAIEAMNRESVHSDYLESFVRVFDKHARQMDLLSQQPEDRETFQRYEAILKSMGELQASARSESRVVSEETVASAKLTREEKRYAQIVKTALKRVKPEQTGELDEFESGLSAEEDTRLDQELKQLAGYFAETGDLGKAAVMFWLIKDDKVAAGLAKEMISLKGLGEQRTSMVQARRPETEGPSSDRKIAATQAQILISRAELANMAEENFLAFYKFFYQNQELELSVYGSGSKNPEEEARVGLLEAVPSAKTGRVSFFLDPSAAAQGGEAIEFSSVPGTKTVRGKKIAAADIRTVEGMASGFLAAMGMEYTEEKGFVRVTSGVEISRFFEFLSWQVFAASA